MRSSAVVCRHSWHAEISGPGQQAGDPQCYTARVSAHLPAVGDGQLLQAAQLSNVGW